MKLLEKYGHRKLHQKAALVKRQVKLPKPDSIRKVAVLWEPSERLAFKFLHDHFSHVQVIFRNLCIYPKDDVAETGANILTHKDLNWYGLPKPGPVDDFINTEFDILLNIALNQSLQFDYVTALSRARFKIGSSKEETNFFDLNINIIGKQDALYLARQQIFYLGQLNKTM